MLYKQYNSCFYMSCFPICFSTGSNQVMLHPNISKLFLQRLERTQILYRRQVMISALESKDRGLILCKRAVKGSEKKSSEFIIFLILIRDLSLAATMISTTIKEPFSLFAVLVCLFCLFVCFCCSCSVFVSQRNTKYH